MPISYLEETKTFYIDTSDSTYAFCIHGPGRLVHLYYGARLPHEDLRDMIRMSPWHSSNDPGDYEMENHFSQNISMMEYPTGGTGDFRPSALTVEAGDGTLATDLRYLSHRIYRGKAMPEGLPALHTEAQDCETLEVTLRDEKTGVTSTLVYTAFDAFPVITRHNRILNGGKEAVSLLRVASASVTLSQDAYDVCYLPGTYLQERSFTRETLPRGTFTLGSDRGESGHWCNPFVAITSPDTTEKQGAVYAFSYVYSGSFLISCNRDNHENVRVNVGMHPDSFRWYLAPGECFTTPETVLLYNEGGLGEMTRLYHRLFRKHLLRGEWKDKKRPLLINSWEAAFFDFNEEKLYNFAMEAKKLGIEMLVMDDGWFSRRSDDTTSLGDWWVNEEKLKGGLGALVDRIHAQGMKFGIWYEPEMVSPESDLFRAHPDWCIHVEGRPHSDCRRQCVLDLSRPEVVEEIYRQMTEVLDRVPVDYIKWDFNRPLTEVGSAALPKERQGEVWHRFMLGSYQLYDKITSRYPHILLENCASGGGRFDAGMLYYSSQIWASDNTDPVSRIDIQFGTSLCYPTATMGAHVSANPRTAYDFKGNVALWGSFGYELDPLKATEAEKALFRQQIETYHKTYDVIHFGELYRLISPWEGKPHVAWMHVSEDKSRAVLTVATLRKPKVDKFLLALDGLLPEALYREEETGAVYSGARLMRLGLNLTLETECHRDYGSLTRCYTRIG